MNVRLVACIRTLLLAVRYFIQNGGNIVTLQKILGHSTLAMTMRYAHLAPDHLLDAVRLGPATPC